RAVFEREWHEANGPGGRALLWMRTARDILSNVIRVHADIARQDVHYAVRSLSRSPGFSITAILVAALGIGATTATFSIADHVLLRPRPFANPDRLVKLWESQPSRGYPRIEPTPPNYRDWKATATSFDAMGAYTTDGASLIGVGDPERLQGGRVTGEV